MDRRAFLAMLAAGVAATASGCAEPRHTGTPPTRRTTPAPKLVAEVGSTVPRVEPPAVIDRLAPVGKRLALTVDDGTNSEVVAAYIRFAQDTGARFTFFANGVYDSWRANAQALRPLVDRGQIQLGNHTWSHPDLRSLRDLAVREQLTRNDAFIQDTYGVTTKPYLRPPFGSYDNRTSKIATDLGWGNTVLWYGSLGDSTVLTERRLLANARRWLHANRVVIAHANYPAVTHIYEEMLRILDDRDLHMVTLDDVFVPVR